MKTSLKTILTTSILALAAGHVVAMNGGEVVPGPELGDTGAVSLSQVGDVSCSGTLLAPTWVLTARHCLVPKVLSYANGNGQTFNVPADKVSGAANGGLWFFEHYISAGWIAPAGTPDKLRKATLMSVDKTGGVGGGFGVNGYSTIVFNDAAITSSELTDVIKVKSSSDLIAIGNVQRGGNEQMLVARFDQFGALKAAAWPTSNPGATVAFSQIQGHAVRAIPIDDTTDDKFIVAGWDFLDGFPRWRATRYTPAGTVDPSFAPFFGNFTRGTLQDLVQVGAHLVWLGTMEVSGTDRQVIVVSDLDGHSQLQASLDMTVVPNPVRLLARGDADSATTTATAVWVIGTDYTHMAARVARLSIATLLPDADWPTHGVSMTQAPEVGANVEVTSAMEDAGRLVVVGNWHVDDTPLSMVARFTTDGVPDGTFGQSGLIVPINHYDQYAAAIVAGPHAGQIAVIGRSDIDPADKNPFPHFWTTVYDDGQDVASSTTIGYAGATGAIKQVIRHEDPSVDIALVELYAPLSDAARKVAVSAYNTVPMYVMRTNSETIECRAYGGHDSDGDGTDDGTGVLRRGAFLPDTSDGQEIRFLADEPNRIIGGDSGGGCVIQRAGVTYLVGVVEESSGNPKPTGTKGALQTWGHLVDPLAFDDFVHRYVPGW